MSQNLETTNLTRSGSLTSAAGLRATGNDAANGLRPTEGVPSRKPLGVPDLPKIKELVSRVQDALQRNETKLEIDVSEGPPEQVVVSIVDRETGEVVRQFPSEELVQLARNLHAHNTGLLHEQA